MSEETRLAAALRERVHEVGPSRPLGLEDVKGRARSIRRRRYAVSGLAAAAALAVAVPTGLAAQSRLDRGTDPGPAVTPSVPVTPSPTPPEVPAGPVAIDTSTSAESAGPGIPVLYDEVIHLPSGAQVEVPRSTAEFLPLGDGWLVLERSGDEASVSYLYSSNEVAWTEPATGSLVVSPAGGVAAFGQPDRSVVTVGEDGERYPLSALLPKGYEVAAMIGGAGSCTDEDGLGGCTIYANHEQDLSGLSISHHRAGSGAVPTRRDRVDDLTGHVSGVSPDLLLGRIVSVDDTGNSCSQVDALASGEANLWRTCRHRLGAFSPDGRRVVGHPANRSGEGDSSIAILDAPTGDVLVEYRNSAKSQAFVTSSAWDVDGTLLATVAQGGRTSLMRMTTDGTLSHAGSAGASWPSEDGTMPARLPVQP